MNRAVGDRRKVEQRTAEAIEGEPERPQRRQQQQLGGQRAVESILVQLQHLQMTQLPQTGRQRALEHVGAQEQRRERRQAAQHGGELAAVRRQPQVEMTEVCAQADLGRDRGEVHVRVQLDKLELRHPQLRRHRRQRVASSFEACQRRQKGDFGAQRARQRCLGDVDLNHTRGVAYEPELRARGVLGESWAPWARQAVPHAHQRRVLHDRKLRVACEREQQRGDESHHR